MTCPKKIFTKVLLVSTIGVCRVKFEKRAACLLHNVLGTKLSLYRISLGKLE